jgi:hypothetical protein
MNNFSKTTSLENMLSRTDAYRAAQRNKQLRDYEIGGDDHVAFVLVRWMTVKTRHTPDRHGIKLSPLAASVMPTSSDIKDAHKREHHVREHKGVGANQVHCETCVKTVLAKRGDIHKSKHHCVGNVARVNAESDFFSSAALPRCTCVSLSSSSTRARALPRRSRRCRSTPWLRQTCCCTRRRSTSRRATRFIKKSAKSSRRTVHGSQGAARKQAAAA